VVSKLHRNELVDNASRSIDSETTDGVLPSLQKPESDALVENSLLRHGPDGGVGAIIRYRRALGYFSAEEFYETTLDGLVQDSTRWLDVGCGRDLLPMNPKLARLLASRCTYLMGIDPDDNVLENDFVHDRKRSGIEDFRADEPFDLISLRMVVEHIQTPDRCVESLRDNTRRGGKVIVYTPYKYSLSSIASTLVPNRFHHAMKRRLWGTEQRDTFPTWYRMNTATALGHVFSRHGFQHIALWKIDDAGLLHSKGAFGKAELLAWSAFRRLRLPYPEVNLLGVFAAI
jgi:SAM-dependent methyltransferase